MTISDAAATREAHRTDLGQFGSHDHSEPELALEPDGETREQAEDRGISDARALRTPSPGYYADEYMAGYESELMDLGDSWA
ncbi:hypothetical protein [Microbacterium sp. 77mftsu3.1]|uniref:hypothetical protein n=1 Tax=Microbacterium sp. 77mftsu3.1 TaxID=1761802 RepID=UPI00036CD04B|nr:hypothetical protein [Microbacterium sp. 77mftsu3.1]SDH33392.1 hypothetical protein SAMN04488590_3055 [Microbacterium sp. 77mftsu3.1]